METLEIKEELSQEIDFLKEEVSVLLQSLLSLRRCSHFSLPSTKCLFEGEGGLRMKLEFVHDHSEIFLPDFFKIRIFLPTVVHKLINILRVACPYLKKRRYFFSI